MDKKLKDLDDVEKVLKQNTVEEVIERKAARRRKTAMQRRRQAIFRRDGGILMIPAAIVVLMIVIVILDHTGGSGKDQTPAASIATGSDIAAATASDAEDTSTEDGDPAQLKEYNDNVMEDFFKSYFDARIKADTDTLYKLTGVTNQTDAQTATLKSQLQTQAGYIEQYQNLKLYAAPAIEKNSKLVFVTYEVKFRRADTAAPGIMYCYVIVNDKNEFEIVENMSAAQTKFVNTYLQEHSEATTLINSVNSQLLEAITADSRLAVIYDAFQTGRIYTDDQSKIDSEVSLISVETEPEESTEADGGSEAASAEEDRTQAETESSAAPKTTKAQSGKPASTAGETEAPNADVIDVGSDPGASAAPATSAAAAKTTTAAGGSPAGSGDVIEAGEGPQTAG